MKQTLLLISLFFYSISPTECQSCLPNGITFSSQEAIDNFSLNYPACTTIEGDVTINDDVSLNIHSLQGLSQITRIDGDLEIYRNSALAELTGLHNLERIGGDFSLSWNLLSDTIIGLDQLQEIAGNCYIAYNGFLQSLDGLDGVEHIGGNLQVSSSRGLKSLSGLHHLKEVGGDLNISRNDSLLLVDFPNLEQVGNHLTIFWNRRLNTVGDFELLTSVGGQLSIEEHNLLEEIGDFAILEQIGEGISIQKNSQLKTIEGFNRFYNIDGSIEILENSALETISGFSNLYNLYGSIDIGSNEKLATITAFEDIRYIYGDLELHANDSLAVLDGFWEVRRVEGDLVINSTKLTALSNFSFLTEIFGTLSCSGNDLLTNLYGLHKVKEVGGSVNISANANLTTLEHLDNISSVDGGVSIRSNAILEAIEPFRIALGTSSQSTNVYNSIYITDNPKLKHLKDQYIGGHTKHVIIKNNENLLSLPNFNNARITDFCDIVGNPLLQDLSGMEGLHSVSEYLTIANNGIKSLDGLKVAYTVSNLGIIDNLFLEDIKALSFLEKVDASLTIRNNPALQSLEGLESLVEIEDNLRINENPLLTSLFPFRSLVLDPLNNEVNITENENLSVCDNIPICNFLIAGGVSTIESNKAGCNMVDQILGSCDRYKLLYEIYYDENANALRDSGEVLYLGAGISIAPIDLIHFQTSDQGGIVFLEDGDYEIMFNKWSVPHWDLTTPDSTYTISIEQTSPVPFLRFGIKPNQTQTEHSTFINAFDTRCNSFSTFAATTKNRGTSVTAGVLWMEIDTLIKDITFAIAPDTTVSDHKVGWFFDRLLPGQVFSRTMRLFTPGQNIDFDNPMRFKATTAYTDQNNDSFIDEFQVSTYILCSWDPNDKLVHPDRDNNETLFEEELIYTIRFQNTGNAEAYDVVIRDTLDSNLDIESFQVLSTSHPQRLETTITENKYLTFSFYNIYLPDSTTNYEESQGFVSYRIEPIEGLPENTSIFNSAGIYFDANLPVITNTTENILVTELTTISTVNIVGSSIQVFPNPGSGMINIVAPKESPILALHLFDQSGRLLLAKKSFRENAIDISKWAAGIYILEMFTDEGVIRKKIVKME